ncbi:MAG: hypothetical protein ACRBF0_08480 [Calditrichia bacterium]
MSKKIDIYAPNISKENLISLLFLQLTEIGDRIEMNIIKQERRLFRAPEMEVFMKEEDVSLTAAFTARLFEVAKGLGGTRFVFKGENNEELRSDVNITTCNLIDLSESVSKLDVKKIEIY